MNVERNLGDLKRHLSLHLHSLLPPPLCDEIIARYDDAQARGSLGIIENELIDACRALVFTEELNSLLTRYFQGPFEPLWPIFDVVGSEGYPHNLNAVWHLDGGMKGTHKLFIYLNAVAEHGGNTVMMDQQRTNRLRQADALPVEEGARREDLSEVCGELGISPEVLAYGLKAGDGLLFDPLRLAHRCQPPMKGKRRYTICFSVVPLSSYQTGAHPQGRGI